MANDFKVLLVVQVPDVFLTAGEKVVRDNHFVTVGQQPVRKVGAEETGSAGDEDAHPHMLGDSDLPPALDKPAGGRDQHHPDRHEGSHFERPAQ